MLEKEYKAILTRSEYDAVKGAFSWDWVKEQTNNYYTDDDGVFFKNRIMFRVREKDGKCVIQVKSKKNVDNALQICEEREFPIDGVPSVIENVREYTDLECGNIRRMGAAKTLRCSKMWDDSTEICLDKTEYFDKCDYEIEVEYTASDIPDDLKNVLAELGITFTKKAIGKFSRFLEEYNKQ